MLSVLNAYSAFRVQNENELMQSSCEKKNSVSLLNKDISRQVYFYFPMKMCPEFL